MKQFRAPILSQTFLCEDYYQIQFRWDAEPPLPGQFFSLRSTGLLDPLLRRPFAFAAYNPGTRQAAMIYQVRGKATRLLRQKPAGGELDFAGPFGNSFELLPGPEPVYLVAGGIGLGPMLYLGQWLKEWKREFVFIYGCRKAELVPRTPLLAELGAVICTDDGSRGFEGTVVDYLNSLEGGRTATLAGCGPLPMLKGCHEYALSRGWECLVSMEEMMACSVGACAGCVIKTTAPLGYSKVCSDGAVFRSREILWD